MGNPFGPSHNSFRQAEAVLIRRVHDERDAIATFAALRAQIEAIESTGVNVAVGACMPFSNEMLYVQQLGYEGRNVIFLVGERAGARVRLVVHHNQLQVLLVPVNRENGQDSGKQAKVLYIVPDEEPTPEGTPTPENP